METAMTFFLFFMFLSSASSLSIKVFSGDDTSEAVWFFLLMSYVVFVISTLCFFLAALITVADNHEPSEVLTPETITCERFYTSYGSIVRCIDAENRNICYWRDGSFSCVQLYETSDVSY